jgi:hypothetical protein
MSKTARAALCSKMSFDKDELTAAFKKQGKKVAEKDFALTVPLL